LASLDGSSSACSEVAATLTPSRLRSRGPEHWVNNQHGHMSPGRDRHPCSHPGTSKRVTTPTKCKWFRARPPPPAAAQAHPAAARRHASGAGRSGRSGVPRRRGARFESAEHQRRARGRGACLMSCGATGNLSAASAFPRCPDERGSHGRGASHHDAGGVRRHVHGLGYLDGPDAGATRRPARGRVRSRAAGRPGAHTTSARAERWTP
jgi:hypothetical protein